MIETGTSPTRTVRRRSIFLSRARKNAQCFTLKKLNKSQDDGNYGAKQSTANGKYRLGPASASLSVWKGSGNVLPATRRTLGDRGKDEILKPGSVSRSFDPVFWKLFLLILNLNNYCSFLRETASFSCRTQIPSIPLPIHFPFPTVPPDRFRRRLWITQVSVPVQSKHRYCCLGFQRCRKTLSRYINQCIKFLSHFNINELK